MQWLIYALAAVAVCGMVSNLIRQTQLPRLKSLAEVQFRCTRWFDDSPSPEDIQTKITKLGRKSSSTLPAEDSERSRIDYRIEELTELMVKDGDKFVTVDHAYPRLVDLRFFQSPYEFVYPHLSAELAEEISPSRLRRHGNLPLKGGFVILIAALLCLAGIYALEVSEPIPLPIIGGLVRLAGQLVLAFFGLLFLGYGLMITWWDPTEEEKGATAVPDVPFSLDNPVRELIQTLAGQFEEVLLIFDGRHSLPEWKHRKKADPVYIIIVRHGSNWWLAATATVNTEAKIPKDLPLIESEL